MKFWLPKEPHGGLSPREGVDAMSMSFARLPTRKELEDRLREAVAEGDLKVVKEIAGYGKMPSGCVCVDLKVNVDSRDEPLLMTALMYAATCGKTPIVKVLLTSGANPNLKTIDGFTALMYATFYGHIGVVKALLAGGAKKGLRNKWGETAYRIAIVEDCPEIARLLAIKRKRR